MKNKFWLTISQIIVGFFLFSLGLIIVLVLFISGDNLNKYNRDEVIALNLASEQIELFKNIRDSNYEKSQVLNQINPDSDNYDKLFEVNKGVL